MCRQLFSAEGNGKTDLAQVEREKQKIALDFGKILYNKDDI